ncbi:unnamed protein product [Polarella glacialis]|uniref:MARVEL domain-containing protein n=1 Tax=Polarella glacialis TaxID=89957 RepID=A0A813M024_POLGL|nr:unnamed protein product [Polarella glacialis]CAE8742334.1 unnamed protein product [Polarella glacialis]
MLPRFRTRTTTSLRIGFLIIVQQHYTIFLTYWDLRSQIVSAAAYSDTSFWLVFNSFVCFYVSVMVCGVLLGDWIDGSKTAWWFFFFAHLVGGLAYTVATFKLGAAICGADGEKCAAANTGFGDKSAAVWETTQAAFYVPYVVCMVSLAYQVIIEAIKVPYVPLRN